VAQDKIELFGDRRIVRMPVRVRCGDACLTFIRNHPFMFIALTSLALLVGATAFLLWMK
jgi:hypothetical protein